MSRLKCFSMVLSLFCGALVILPSFGLGSTGDAASQDKVLFDAIWDLQEAVLENGPESIKFPWDPRKHKRGEEARRPDFTSWYARTPKIGEDPRVRHVGGQITSTIFVGAKRVGERFKVENWRVWWERNGAGYIARSRDVIQSFDELYVPFDRKEPPPDKSFPRRVFEFDDLRFAYDCLRFSVKSGRLVLVEVDGRPLAAFILGEGKLFYKPPRQLASDVPDSVREAQQFEHHLKVKHLNGCKFGNAIVWGHPDWMRGLLGKLQLRPVEDRRLQAKAREAFFERLLPTMSRLGRAFGGRVRPLCLLPESHDFFWVEFDTSGQGLISYLYNPTAPREITVGGRSRLHLRKRRYGRYTIYCEYDRAEQRKSWSRRRLEHESKDSVKTMSWSVKVRFEKGKLDKVKEGEFRIIFDYKTLEPNCSKAVFDFWRLEPTAVTDVAGNDILFFETGSQLIIPVDPVDGEAWRTNILYASGVGPFSEVATCMDGWLPDTGYLECRQFDLTVTVPEKFVVAAVGKVVDERVLDGYRTKKWVGDHCARFPGFVIGKLRVFDFNVEGKPLWVFGDDGAFARNYVYPEIESSLRFYTRLFGEYPYSKLSVCPVNWCHGRGFATLLTVTHFSSATVFGNMLSLGDWQAGLYCHEVSHQWWGNIVGWFSPADQWLSEGFAEMSTLMYLQSARNNKSVRDRLKAWGYYAKKYDEYGPICLGYSRLGRASFQLIYHKGAYVMHMLRMIVGDEAMIRILRTFVEQFKWKRATTSDFEEACELALGAEELIKIGGEPSLRWFFDEWIYGTGYPRYEYCWSKRRAKDGLWEVICRIEQVGKKLFKMPLPIWIFTEDGGRYLSRKLVDKKEHKFVLRVPSKPKKVELDPFHNVLCDIKAVRSK